MFSRPGQAGATIIDDNPLPLLARLTLRLL